MVYWSAQRTCRCRYSSSDRRARLVRRGPRNPAHHPWSSSPRQGTRTSDLYWEKIAASEQFRTCCLDLSEVRNRHRASVASELRGEWFPLTPVIHLLTRRRAHSSPRPALTRNVCP